MREFVANAKAIKYLKWEGSWFQRVVQQRSMEFRVI